MKIAIVGLGSMGKRRIRLIQELYPEYELSGIDGREDRREETNSKYGIPCFKSIDDANDAFDCIFVCTSPLSHNSIIRQALNGGSHVFTELNLVSDGYEENMTLASEKGLHLFLSSTFLYREEINYIRKAISNDKKWDYIYHIGQYLPDWHPWESYKDFFLGDVRTNGCREIMAIELPWIIETFGDVTGFNVVADKISNLKIDYKDNFMIQMTHKKGNKGSLIVDVVSPCAVRHLDIFSENEYISWAGTPDSLKRYDSCSGEMKQVDLDEKAEHVNGYKAFVVENAYRNEIEEFFNVVLNEKEPVYNFEQDLKILKLIDSIGA